MMSISPTGKSSLRRIFPSTTNFALMEYSLCLFSCLRPRLKCRGEQASAVGNSVGCEDQMRVSLPKGLLSCESARILALVYVLILLVFPFLPKFMFLLQFPKSSSASVPQSLRFLQGLLQALLRLLLLFLPSAAFLSQAFFAAFSPFFFIIGFFRSRTAFRILSSRFRVFIMIFEGCNATNTVVPSTFSRVNPSRKTR